MNANHIEGRKNEQMSDTDFHASLPRKVSSAGCLFQDAAQHVLIVKPTYKEGWEIPGGISELGESPRMTAQREVLEELGLEVRVGRLLCMDHVMPEAGKLEGLHFVFDGGVFKDAEIRAIRLPETELSEFRFVPIAEAQALLVRRLGPRLGAAFAALEAGETLYLESGQRVF